MTKPMQILIAVLAFATWIGTANAHCVPRSSGVPIASRSADGAAPSVESANVRLTPVDIDARTPRGSAQTSLAVVDNSVVVTSNSGLFALLSIGVLLLAFLLRMLLRMGVHLARYLGTLAVSVLRALPVAARTALAAIESASRLVRNESSNSRYQIVSAESVLAFLAKADRPVRKSVLVLP